MNKEYELLEYLCKFLDENVLVESVSGKFKCTGTCTAIEPMLPDCDVYILSVRDEYNNEHTFHIASYNYKLQIWFDGNLKEYMHIEKI